MIIAVTKETATGETRVALTPDYTANLTALGWQVKIEHNAGQLAGFCDEEYRIAGAEICQTTKKTLKQADLILKIWAPELSELNQYTTQQTIICDTRNIHTFEHLKAFSKARINLFALDLMPRISRAQNMDILSSQNNLAGYVAVIKGASLSKNIMPLLITSAGTLPPLKVLIIGLGVTGLQAVSTAHRLGAQVFAYDNRPETAEQASSLGATFSPDLSKELLSSVALIITSAQIFGKPAPKLFTARQYKWLYPLSTIIDMAADSGGNINPIQLSSTINLIQDSHLERYVPSSASTLFAGNLFNFCRYITKENKLQLDFNDEIIATTSICCHGQLKHPFLSGE